MACAPDPNENQSKAEWRIREAAAKGAQIICVQELFRSQYFCREEDSAWFDLAETRQLLAATARRPVGAAEASAVRDDYDGWATGVRLAALGRPVAALAKLEVPKIHVTDTGVDGEVLRVDRFGNLTTNIDGASLGKMSGAVTVRIGSHLIPRILLTYADATPGELCALVGSSDRLEIAVNGGSAAATLGLGRGAVVQLRRSA